MTPRQFHRVVMSFPEVEESTSYGQPSYKAFGKFLTRLRCEDASCVLGCVDFDEREMLCAADPAMFHVTDHYKNYPFVLTRIAALDEKSLRNYLTRQWRKNAPKRWLAAWEAGQGAIKPDQAKAKSAKPKNKPPRR